MATKSREKKELIRNFPDPQTQTFSENDLFKKYCLIGTQQGFILISVLLFSAFKM
jgi:hypothetical protein